MSPMELRPYQRDAVEAVYRHLRERDDHPCVVIPTGGGKTPVIARICRDVAATWNGRALVLAHVKELLEQSVAKLQGECPMVPIGVFSAGLGRRDTREAVIVAGIQSVYQRAEELGRFDIILIDEAHLLPPDGEGMYRTFLAGARAINPNVRLVGFTATPFRLNDGPICGPDNLLNHVCFEIGVRELIRDGYLSPLVSKAGRSQVDTSALHVRGGEFIPDEVAHLVDQDDVVRAACAEIITRTKDREACLIFAAGVEHAMHVVAILREHQVTAEAIFGDTSALVRDDIIRRFRRGDLSYLVNVNVLTTGFDAPHVDTIALLRPTMSPGLYYQMCLDMETEVLTRRGWKLCDEVSVGDQVGAFEMSSGLIVWSEATDKVHRPLAPEEVMYGVKAPHLDIRVTGGHMMVYRGRSKTCRNWRRKEACELATYSDSFNIPVAGVNNGPGLPLSDDEIRFIGWALTDGHHNPHNNTLVISQSANSPYLSNIEKMLNGCGLGFRRYRQKRSGNLACYPDAITFVIPYGPPRGVNRHLHGWAHLGSYINRTILDSLRDISQLQVEVLLEAMELADGSKTKPTKWIRRTRTIAIGQHRFLADQLQILLIQRGYRCNIAIRKQRTAWHKNEPAATYILHIRRRSTSTVGGAAFHPSQFVQHRCSLGIVPFDPDERVWCLTTAHGTLVTRRNGKVAIVGNCGRGFRLAPGKKECLILDFGENVVRHGPVDGITVERKTMASGDAPAKECPECQTLIASGYALCPECGYQFPPRVAERHEAQAGDRGLITGDVTTTVHEVLRTIYSVHLKRGAPDDAPKTFRVEYQTSWRNYQSEWICVEHEGWARQKAEAWWRARSRAPLPLTAAEAVAAANEGALCTTTSITVRSVAGEPFDRIIAHQLGEKPPWRQMGDVDEPPPETYASTLSDDEVPF